MCDEWSFACSAWPKLPRLPPLVRFLFRCYNVEFGAEKTISINLFGKSQIVGKFVKSRGNAYKNRKLLNVKYFTILRHQNVKLQAWAVEKSRGFHGIRTKRYEL